MQGRSRPRLADDAERTSWSAGTARWRTSSPPSAGTRPRPRPPGSAPTSACPTGCSARPSARSPAASAAASSWPGSCSATRRDGGGILLLDEPTNHLDADSITWLRGFLAGHKGGLIVISHDGELLEAVVNKVWYLDANPGRGRRLQRRLEDVPGAARDRRAAPPPGAGQRREEGRRADGAGRQDAGQGHQGRGRAEHGPRAEKLLSGLEDVRVADKVAKVRFPSPAPCGKTPLTAEGLSKSYGSLEIFTDVDVAVDRGSRVVILGLNGAGKTTLLRHARRAAGSPTPARCKPGHGLRLGYYAQEHETLDVGPDGAGEHAQPPPSSRPTPSCARSSARSSSPATTSTSRPGCSPAARRPGWRWPPWSVPAPTCCCSTSRRTTSTRSAGSRCSTRIATYPGAIVLVTHDPGAVAGAQAGPGDPAARRRRGRLERRPARTGRAGLTRTGGPACAVGQPSEVEPAGRARRS